MRNIKWYKRMITVIACLTAAAMLVGCVGEIHTANAGDDGISETTVNESSTVSAEVQEKKTGEVPEKLPGEPPEGIPGDNTEGQMQPGQMQPGQGFGPQGGQGGMQGGHGFGPQGGMQGGMQPGQGGQGGMPGMMPGQTSQVTDYVSVNVDASDVFSDRDLEQTVDTSAAKKIAAADGQTVEITEEGVYVLSGKAVNFTVKINAEDEAKVQLVLDGLNVTNDSFPVIYVVSADKVFVTTAKASDNTLAVTGDFIKDGDTKTDAVIFAKDDLTLNGLGTLNVNSAAGNGITCKDDLKITGGSYVITSTKDAIEANDSVSVYDGTFQIETDKDAVHCENDDDDTVGSVKIYGGLFSINAADDGIQGTSYTLINGGQFDITAAEGIEGTVVEINSGTITIAASDDGINASDKSSAYYPFIVINDGTIKITMGQGDTDALDSNGGLIINGGTIDITAQFAFDYDGIGQLNGGTVTVNGSEVTQIGNSMMGGGFGGQGGMNDGFGGGTGGFGGPGGHH
jgi:hypothetical protein